MSTLDTMRGKDELRTMAAIQNMAPMVERIAGNISRQVDTATAQAESLGKIADALDPDHHDRQVVALETIAEHLGTIANHLDGVTNVIDTLDTNLGHHLGDVVDAIKAS